MCHDVCTDDTEISHDGDGDSPGTGTSVEGKLSCVKISSTLGQTVATAITYSFIQRKRHPEKTPIVPTIHVFLEGFYVFFYDCKCDYLL